MRFRKTMAVGWVAALLAAGAPAHADPPSPGSTVDSEPGTPSGPPRTVTLVTGDRVVMYAPDNVVFEPGPGRESIGYSAHTTWSGERREITVVPSDAGPMLASGLLDPRLFQVSRLLREGHTATLPLIVRHSGGSLAAGDATSLSAIGAEAFEVDAGGAAALWSRVTGSRLAGGVEKIWLDGTSRLLLDRSVPQVGAPAAWRAGYDGTGVTVAVLDSGYDPAHPDLAGRVVEARDFTGTSPEAVDGNGHGTHVASTVAGTGAASNGRYKGLAPGASLLIGKVCDDGGVCADSDIIAGLQWAAGKNPAAINLSLGGDPSDGTDPLSMAVEEIGATTDTLVVVAAGNYGLDRSVSSPASAGSALAVASVTKEDALSDFSSRGPRYGDGAVKPDIAAPGDDITAARAAGTEGEGPYTAKSGTSMASPHVAGAAAILKQRHPGWTGERLKSALMGAATGLDGLGADAVGAGRLDVARAIAQDVVADYGSVSFPMQAFPHDGPVVDRKVAYTNTSAVEVTLALSVSGDAFSIDRSSLTIPAGGTATVVVSARGAGLASGYHGGVVTATAPGVSVRTALGVDLEPELYDLSVRPIGRADGGAITYMYAAVFNVDTQESYAVWEPGMTLRIPAGRYAVFGGIRQTDGAAKSQTSFSDDVDLRADREVVWDAARGRANGVSVQRKAATWGGADVMVAANEASTMGHNVTLMYSGDTTSYTAGGDMPGPNSWYIHDEKLLGDGVSYDLSFPARGAVPEGSVRALADSSLAEVRTRYQSQGRVPAAHGERNDAFAGVKRGVSFGQTRDQPIPATMVEMYSPGPWSSFLTPHDETGGEPTDRRVELTAGVSYQSWNAAPIGVSLDPVFPAFQRHPDGMMTFRAGLFDSAEHELFGGYGGGADYTGSTVVKADGTEIFNRDESICNGIMRPLPAGFDGTISIACEGRRKVGWSELGTRASAEWSFALRPGADVPTVSAVRFDASGVSDGYARRSLPQLVVLEVREQAGAAPTAVRDLVFEVSYDEGATWKKVPVTRVGDAGLATLTHPAGATSVSTRLSAVDDAGGSVRQTMIRSYGLR
ncbi:serine protease [Actinorhabdospora filicis]|uniref:Serine protease n=1 Tax=Actinorhabdospora filicis TaxID=1785913 RepID=A0A9W6SMK8_9ACTN|nr:S8 family serine peptidase [Actinorhabdospora filicis]GLZ78542.1 serine protease [Actinorhabdospora filicis]